MCGTSAYSVKCGYGQGVTFLSAYLCLNVVDEVNYIPFLPGLQLHSQDLSSSQFFQLSGTSTLCMPLAPASIAAQFF